jgi:hypothetical protein
MPNSNPLSRHQRAARLLHDSYSPEGRGSGIYSKSNPPAHLLEKLIFSGQASRRAIRTSNQHAWNTGKIGSSPRKGCVSFIIAEKSTADAVKHMHHKYFSPYGPPEKSEAYPIKHFFDQDTCREAGRSRQRIFGSQPSNENGSPNPAFPVIQPSTV